MDPRGHKVSLNLHSKAMCPLVTATWFPLWELDIKNTRDRGSGEEQRRWRGEEAEEGRGWIVRARPNESQTVFWRPYSLRRAIGKGFLQPGWGNIQHSLHPPLFYYLFTFMFMLICIYSYSFKQLFNTNSSWKSKWPTTTDSQNSIHTIQK